MRHRTGNQSAASGARRGTRAVLLAAACGALGIGAWVGLHGGIPSIPGLAGLARKAAPSVEPQAAKATAARDAWIDPAFLDPALTLGQAPRPLGQSLPLSAGFVPVPASAATAKAEPTPAMPDADRAGDGADEIATLPLPETPDLPTVRLVRATPMPVPRPAELRAVAEQRQDADSLPVDAAEDPVPAGLAAAAPMPMPRPPEFRAAPAAEQSRVAAAPSPRRTRMAAAPAVPAATPDRRSFLAKLFGMDQPSGTALAYAAPQDDAVESSRGARLSGQAVAPAQATAVYDISAQAVYLPSGEKLEAHSGLGSRRDDPRYIHEPMRGPTPPHVYELALREKLFHGVQALRLNPVGGAGAIHGRVGLLAHTFMLGPNGDSNGCVSIRDYDRFLKAYLRGEIKRLVVVARMG